MASAIPYPVQKSTDTLSLVQALSNVNQRFTTLLPRVLYMPIRFVGALALHIILWALNRSIRKNQLRFLAIKTENYAQIMKKRQQLAYLLNAFNAIRAGKAKATSPWIVRLVLNDVRELCHLGMEQYHILGESLSQFDSNTSSGILLKEVSQDTLWENRTKAYAYKL